MVYAKFGVISNCIMGNVKIANGFESRLFTCCLNCPEKCERITSLFSSFCVDFSLLIIIKQSIYTLVLF